MKSKLSQKLLAGILSVAMLLNMGITPVFATTEGALPIGTSRVCTHHIHDDKCGYTEGAPCNHEHTDECYTEVTKCVHEHTADCYPVQDSGEATGSDAKEPTAEGSPVQDSGEATDSEATGGDTKVPTAEGSPAQDSSDTTGSEAKEPTAEGSPAQDSSDTTGSEAKEPTAEGSPVQDSGEATGSDAKEPTACTHICDEKSGCITKELACKHVHDDKCGYTEGKPCTFDPATCEICNPKDSGMIANTITAFAPLAQSEYALPVGADEETIANVLVFPKTIKATINDTETELAVKWESDKALSTETADTFTYTAKLTDEGNQNHTLADGVAMPQIAVMVVDAVQTMAVTDGWQYPVSAEGIAWIGEGTSQSPYLIKTAQDLANLAYMVNNGTTYVTTDMDWNEISECFKLMNDIDLNPGFEFKSDGTYTGPVGKTPSAWAPIGYQSTGSGVTSSNPFSGNFDGGGHTVSGLYINETADTTHSVGLFGYVEKPYDGAANTVSNVKLDNLYIKSGNQLVGAVTAYASGTTVTDCGISSTCYVSCVANSITSADKGVGGIVGYATGATIQNCLLSGSVSSSSVQCPTGGIVGKFNGKSVDNCWFLQTDTVNKGLNLVGESKTGATAPTNSGVLSAPSSPTAVGAVAGDAQITLNWTAPSSTSGSAAITEYKVAYSTTDTAPTEVSNWTATNSTNTEYTVSGLENGKTYYFWVKAMSEAGESVASASVSAMPMGATPSAGTLAVTTGNSNPTFGTDNAITLTATFDKAAKIGKQRTLAINKVEFKDGETSLVTVAATQNTDGKWVATLDVNTKDWALGEHKLTAEYAGNGELGGSTTNEVTVTVNESYAVYDGSTFCRATQANPSTATSEKITDRNTINHLYVMGASVPEELMLSCTNLKTVICANTVTTIGNEAFMDCTSLTSVNMPAVITIGTSAFSGCEGLASVNMPKATSIGNGAFTSCTSLTSVEMPNVTGIGNGAFSDCAKLASVNMPKATSIGVQAFATCKALKSVEMSEATSIGNEAFLSCTKLASVAMPSATSIGENAFGYCTGLTSVAMPKVTTIGANAFSNCTSLTSVEMPSATTIGKFAFNSCEKLASVEMPKVTTIDNQAFNRCAALTSLTLGATPPATVGTDVFKSCPKTNALTIQGNPDFKDTVLAAYKAVNDGATDELWYGWTLPTSLDGTGLSKSEGTLAVTTGNSNPTFGTDNAITLTATFDKAAKIGKQRALAINEVEFKDGANTLGAIATATQNADGKWVATLNVNTKDWAAGEHKLTAEYAGNHELGGATANVTLTISIDVSLITAAITAADNAKGGIAIYDTAASSVANGTKFVTTAEMSTLNTAIQTATAAKATCTTLAQVQAAVKALDDAVANFKAAIKTGTYTAPVTPPVPDDGGSTGGGSTGGGSSDSSSDSGSGGTVTPPPTTTTPTNPNPPTTGEIKAPATVDKNGNASVTVTDKTVTDAIKKAQDEAKKNGTEKNGVSVELKVDTGKKAPNSISANLPKVVQDTLVREKVDEFKVTSSLVDLTFDNKALQEIQKQAGGDATINASKADVSKLSKEAQEEIGNRPVFNLSITGKDGKTISDFGGGSATVSIPYTLQPNENPNNLQAFFVDAKGELHEVTCTYDPVTKCMVFVTNHFSTYGIGYKENAPKFNDIEKHWAKNDIEFVTARGLLAGTDKATFSPNTAMTRGMFVTALGRLAGADVSGYQKSSFADIKTTDYFMGYVEWASKNGIVKGTSATTFAPNAAISRQEMAVIMTNYAKAMNYTLPKTRTAVTFTDNANIASWAADAVKSMQMAGVIMGKDGNRFDPTCTATRAEASAVLRRYVELVIDKATAQGLDMNDSGKIVYYENGKLFTGTKTIDGTTYHFGNDGICVKIDAVIPDTKKYVIHKIVRGDTLWDIAIKNKCTVAEIVGLNGIKNPNNVPIGTELKIPQK